MGGVAMNCLKCGRELERAQAFCDLCQADMERYPVKPGTPVPLPNLKKPLPPKKPQKPKKKPEEQVQALRFALKWVTAALVVALLAFSLCAGLLLHSLFQEDDTPVIGQNYSANPSSSPEGMFHVKQGGKELPHG